MIFLLVLLTFVAGISISSLAESRRNRATEPKARLELAPSPVLVRSPVRVANPPTIPNR